MPQETAYPLPANGGKRHSSGGQPVLAVKRFILSRWRGEAPLASWSKLKPGDGKPTADEKKQIKKLQKAVAKGTDGAADELATLQKAVVDRQWNADQLKTAGAVLEVGHHGDLTATRGVVKPGRGQEGSGQG